MCLFVCLCLLVCLFACLPVCLLVCFFLSLFLWNYRSPIVCKSNMHYTTVTTGDLALASRKQRHVWLTRPHPPRHSRRRGHTDQDGRRCMPTNDRFGTSEMAVFAHLRRPHSDWFSDHGLSILLPDTPKQVHQQKKKKTSFLPPDSIFIPKDQFCILWSCLGFFYKCHPGKQEKSRKSHQIQSLCLKMLVPQKLAVVSSNIDHISSKCSWNS